MRIETVISGSVATIRLDGRFVFSAHRTFRLAIKDLLAGRCTALEIDFAKVEYVDSAALGMLLLAREELAAVKKTIALIHCGGSVQQVLDVANFQKLFAIR